MFELALKITLAHLAGDFVLQSDKAVKDIRKRRFASPHLYAHFAIHLLLLLLVTGFESRFILPVLLLSVAHILIDILVKFVLETRNNRTFCFFLDQGLHAVTLAVFVRYFYPFEILWPKILDTRFLLLASALVAVTFVASVVMKILLRPFTGKILASGNPRAGKLIGILERLFIFFFVVKGFWEGIGFLLAAKSIFRFGDLKESKDVKLTEYILIGTLLSFGIGMVVAELYLFLVQNISVSK